MGLGFSNILKKQQAAIENSSLRSLSYNGSGASLATSSWTMPQNAMGLRFGCRLDNRSAL